MVAPYVATVVLRKARKLFQALIDREDLIVLVSPRQKCSPLPVLRFQKAIS